ncbi:MAG: MarR family winged helix-turn-helix transcriptional regulator [Chloroflexota bacterium]
MEYFCYPCGMDRQVTPVTALNRIEWLTDLIRLEITLWERIDRRLRDEHGLSLAFFEALYFIGQTSDGSLRVGDLSRALRVTVGGTSKLADRIEAAGLIRREVPADDRRASRLVLTPDGQRKLAAASQTYDAELATVLDAALSSEEQHLLHDRVVHLLSADDGSS